MPPSPTPRPILDYTTIVSPLDGRTGIRMIDEGNLVRAIDANAGIVMITEVRPIAVIFTLPQQQLAQVNAASARGEVTVEALDADGKTVLDRGALQVVDNQVDQTTGHRAHEGGIRQRQPAALARAVRQRARADRHLEAGGDHPNPCRPARTQRHLRLRRAGRPARRPAAHHGGAANRDHGRNRQGYRRRRPRRDHGLCPSQGRRPRVGRAQRGPAGRRQRAGQGWRLGAPPNRKGARRPAPPALRTCRSSVPTSSAARTRCAPVCRRNAAQLSEPCKAASAGQAGGKPREADARKPEGSSTQ